MTAAKGEGLVASTRSWYYESLVAKSKIDKTRDAVFANPVNGNIRWKDVETMLDRLGAVKRELSGSGVSFSLNGVRAVFDRPHPRKECGRGLVKRIRTFLVNAGHGPATDDGSVS
ncbi:MAG: type II toxin-antitoxin system HicA family toxin [Planctomycetota bacterium]